MRALYGGVGALKPCPPAAPTAAPRARMTGIGFLDVPITISVPNLACGGSHPRRPDRLPASTCCELTRRMLLAAKPQEKGLLPHLVRYFQRRAQGSPLRGRGWRG